MMTLPRDPRPGPAEALLARERAELLHDAIGRLPERDRAPVVLCELEGLSHAEAATRLGCPTATVGVRLMRARRKLRDRLARRGVDLDAALTPTLAGSSIRLIPPPVVRGLGEGPSRGPSGGGPPTRRSRRRSRSWGAPRQWRARPGPRWWRSRERG